MLFNLLLLQQVSTILLNKTETCLDWILTKPCICWILMLSFFFCFVFKVALTFITFTFTMGHIRLWYSNLGPNGQLAVGALMSTKLYGDTSKYITLQKKKIYVCFRIQLILLKIENKKKKISATLFTLLTL